jgi:uncharacterized protein YjbI with pentapeptide repeats
MDLRNIVISDGDLYESDLSNSQLDYAIITASLKNVDFRGSSLQHIVIRDTSAEGASFKGADLSFSKLSRVDFSNTNCTDAVFDYATLRIVRMINTTFKNTSFYKADIEHTGYRSDRSNGPDFTGADLFGAFWRDMEAPLGWTLTRDNSLTRPFSAMILDITSAGVDPELAKLIHESHPELNTTKICTLLKALSRSSLHT